MKKIKTIDAVGHVLCHDITQIIKDVKDGPVFKKGHVVREEDIEVLLSVGKDHLYIYEADESMLHENDAADILYNVCKNDYMKPTEVKEGKIYCNNSYLCALDKVINYSCNKYIGYEYNDIYIILSELENHLKQDGIIGLKDTIFEDNINHSVEDLIKFSILYPECVHIKTTIGESKHSNTSMIINQFIRNK